MLDALEDEFRVIIGIQVAKGILFLVSGIWLLQANIFYDIFAGHIIIWGSIEIASCVFTITPTKNSRNIFYLIIFMPFYGSLLMYPSVSILMSLYYLFHISASLSIAIFAGLPFYVLLRSILSPFIVLLMVTEVIVLYRYHAPRWKREDATQTRNITQGESHECVSKHRKK